MPICVATKPDGSPCKSNALHDRPCCWFHEKTNKRALHRAQKKGAHANMRPRLVLPDLPVRLKSPKDVSRLMAETIAAVRCGKLEVKISTAIGYLAAVALNSMTGAASNQVAKVEFIIGPPATTEVPRDPFLEEYEARKKAEEKKAGLALVPSVVDIRRN